MTQVQSLDYPAVKEPTAVGMHAIIRFASVEGTMDTQERVRDSFRHVIMPSSFRRLPSDSQPKYSAKRPFLVIANLSGTIPGLPRVVAVCRDVLDA